MRASPPPILLVSHKANRSGAPLLLLDIAKALKERQVAKFAILCMEDGELVSEFEQIGQTFLWKKNGSTSRAGQIARSLFILYQLRKFRIFFLNTIVHGHLQNKLKRFSRKSVCYVHELEAAIQMLTNEKGREHAFALTDSFVAVSEAVKENLVHKHAVRPEKIKVLASPVAVTHRSATDHSDFVKAFRLQHRIGKGKIFGVLGNAEWRKGFDLLVPLVTAYFHLYPESEDVFVWKGFHFSSYSSFSDSYDLQKSAVKDRIVLLPHGPDSMEHLACFDVHLLLSREDPYPLATLEAASFGIPTICFEGSGGTTEFVEEDCGFSVPYGNLISMAEKLKLLATDDKLRSAQGARCREKLLLRHEKSRAMEAIINTMKIF
ncbi:MAG: glycosyltransferase family 4 protein [Gemmatimonadaceae bacterium]|nr:glycosyltransferase family 4 protein [Chitinophagaceae bacterium]